MAQSLVSTVGGEASPAVVRVLAEARARLGQLEEGGQNKGAIVREVCGPFLSQHRFDEMYAEGKLLWCAAFACFCWWKARPSFRPYVSLLCSTLHANLQPFLLPKEAAPGPGDFIFFQHLEPEKLGELRHVGLVERFVAESGTIHTIEGNSSAGHGDTGGVREQHYQQNDPRIAAFARVQL